MQPFQESAMTMLQTPPTEISQAEYDRLLEEPGVEYAHGRIVEKPMSMEAAKIGATIIGLLQRTIAEASAAVDVFTESWAYRCFADDPRKFRKPDVSVIRAERLKGLDPQAGFCPIPADLTVEVISPNDIASDVAEKVEEYLANGFPLIWIVEPRTRTVTVYRPDSVTRLHGDDEITGESALPSFRCKISEFFPKPPPKA
jgi:Uma2 family endonuclease